METKPWQCSLPRKRRQQQKPTWPRLPLQTQSSSPATWMLSLPREGSLSALPPHAASASHTPRQPLHGAQRADVVAAAGDELDASGHAASLQQGQRDGVAGSADALLAPLVFVISPVTGTPKIRHPPS